MEQIVWWRKKSIIICYWFHDFQGFNEEAEKRKKIYKEEMKEFVITDFYFSLFGFIVEWEIRGISSKGWGISRKVIKFDILVSKFNTVEKKAEIHFSRVKRLLKTALEGQRITRHTVNLMKKSVVWIRNVKRLFRKCLLRSLEVFVEK